MDNNYNIGLTEFRSGMDAIVNDILEEFGNPFFGCAGLLPTADEQRKEWSTPTNSEIFAHTGGDGVHFTLVEITDTIQPVVMTIPLAYGRTPEAYNFILAENLVEFLSLGCGGKGWFAFGDFELDKDDVMAYYAKTPDENEVVDEAEQKFFKKLRWQFAVKPIPLQQERLDFLQKKYFKCLNFDPKFLAKITSDS